MNIDEICGKLEKRRDHGPNDLHELVYQLACVVRGRDLINGHVIALDTALCSRLIAAAGAAEKNWDVAAANEGRQCLPAEYAEGWNAALVTHAAPLAAQLEAALRTVEKLESEICGLQDEVTDLEEQRDMYRARSRSSSAP